MSERMKVSELVRSPGAELVSLSVSEEAGEEGIGGRELVFCEISLPFICSHPPRIHVSAPDPPIHSFFAPGRRLIHVYSIA
jgi:hypothetical protein